MGQCATAGLARGRAGEETDTDRQGILPEADFAEGAAGHPGHAAAVGLSQRKSHLRARKSEKSALIFGHDKPIPII